MYSRRRGIDSVAGAPMSKPLSDHKIALRVTTPTILQIVRCLIEDVVGILSTNALWLSKKDPKPTGTNIRRTTDLFPWTTVSLHGPSR